MNGEPGVGKSSEMSSTDSRSFCTSVMGIEYVV